MPTFLPFSPYSITFFSYATVLVFFFAPCRLPIYAFDYAIAAIFEGLLLFAFMLIISTPPPAFFAAIIRASVRSHALLLYVCAEPRHIFRRNFDARRRALQPDKEAFCDTTLLMNI